jgi:hypothetical protein
MNRIVFHLSNHFRFHIFRFGLAAGGAPFPQAPHPLMELATRSEFQPHAYRGYWFRVPTSPSDLSPALWCFAHSPAGTVCTIPVMPLVGFRVPPESRPVSPSQALRRAAALSAPLMSFPSLQHLPESRIHTRGLATPASFRLQGLVTLVTASAPRHLAGLVSCRQRSWDLSHPSELSPPERYWKPLRLPVDPRAVQPTVAPDSAEGGQVRLVSPGFRALTLSGIPRRTRRG